MGKHIYTAITLLLISTFLTSAQEHMMKVKRYPDYAKDYLTITDIGLFFFDENEIHYYGDNYKTPDGSILWTGTVITGINGISTKGMDEEEFYSILRDNPDSISLCLEDRSHKKSTETIYPQKAWPDRLTDCGITHERLNSLKGEQSPWGYGSLDNIEKEVKKTNTSITELIDSDYDWFYANTYDFIISGNDPLMDKTLLESFAKSCLPNMERDTENPDVLIRVAKSADQSIQTTYIPPSSRTINLGSTTTARYNFFTERNDYITRQNNYTVNEGGYTQTTRELNIFLEIVMLDAKKINDTTLASPPIIWQMTAKRYVVNPKFEVKDELLAYTSLGVKCNPLWNKSCHLNIKAFAPAVIFSGTSVSDIMVGSKAWHSGLRVGDRIVRYKYSKKGKWSKGTAPYISYDSDTVLYSCEVEKEDSSIVKMDFLHLNEAAGPFDFYFWK